jgi:peptidylprolyl isomerase
LPRRPSFRRLLPATPALDPENTLHLDLSTGGRVTIQLRPDVAPRHVERIKTLARQGFYNGIVFHRVIEGFMAQTGDPTATGTGGSPLPDVAAEFNGLPHVRGAVSAARSESPDSANSQFFITFVPRLSLDGKYSVFGRVVSGMQYVDAIQRGEPPAEPSRIVKASIGADNAPPPSPQEVAAAMARPPAPVTPDAPVAPAPAAAATTPEQPQPAAAQQ